MEGANHWPLGNTEQARDNHEQVMFTEDHSQPEAPPAAIGVFPQQTFQP